MIPRAGNAIIKRDLIAKEAFKNASDTIGEITHGMSLFALTRGQFSMIDAVLHCLDCIGPARLSIWTWCIAPYEVQCVNRLRMDERITSALLVIDTGARNKNGEIIADWRARHGPESVKFIVNHAKIATLEGNGFRLLLRGSMNLNYNPRFEQFDLSEGCAGFDLIRAVESELPILPPNHAYKSAQHISKLEGAFTSEQLLPFGGVKTWAK